MAGKREVRSPKPMPVMGVGSWGNSPGTYIAGAAEIDEVDLVAREVERRWGAGRVRLLVPLELREKFDRQRYLFNQAIWFGELEGLRRERPRMIAAWRAVDRAALASGADLASPDVWEVPLSDGRVLALGRTSEDMAAWAASGRAGGREVTLWSLEEVARLIEAGAFLSNVKVAFPGARVEVVRTSIDDPLAGIPSGGDPIDDVIF
jgi:hypothetical protein